MDMNNATLKPDALEAFLDSSTAPPPKKKAKKNTTPSSSTTTNTDSAAAAAAVAAASAALTAALDSHTSPLTSSRASNTPANNCGSMPRHLVQRINQVLSKREAIKRDKASWLSTSTADHLPASLASRYTNCTGMLGDHNEETLPWPIREEWKIIQRAVLKNGLSIEDNVSLEALGCLLEQARKYGLEILSDAYDFAMHRKQKSKFSLQLITPSDISLALDFRADDPSSTIPSNQDLVKPHHCSYGKESVAGSFDSHHLMLLADDVNRIPLPPIPSHNYNGVVLPDPDHQLTAMTFDVVSSKRIMDRMALGGKPSSAATVEAFLANADSVILSADGRKKNEKSTKKSTATSYGVTKGKTIPVHLKSNVENPSMDTSLSLPVTIAAGNMDQSINP